MRVAIAYFALCTGLALVLMGLVGIAVGVGFGSPILGEGFLLAVGLAMFFSGLFLGQKDPEIWGLATFLLGGSGIAQILFGIIGVAVCLDYGTSVLEGGIFLAAGAISLMGCLVTGAVAKKRGSA